MHPFGNMSAIYWFGANGQQAIIWTSDDLVWQQKCATQPQWFNTIASSKTQNQIYIVSIWMLIYILNLEKYQTLN